MTRDFRNKSSRIEIYMPYEYWVSNLSLALANFDTCHFQKKQIFSWIQHIKFELSAQTHVKPTLMIRLQQLINHHLSFPNNNIVFVLLHSNDQQIFCFSSSKLSPNLKGRLLMKRLLLNFLLFTIVPPTFFDKCCLMLLGSLSFKRLPIERGSVNTCGCGGGGNIINAHLSILC